MNNYPEISLIYPITEINTNEFVFLCSSDTCDATENSDIGCLSVKFLHFPNDHQLLFNCSRTKFEMK